MFKKDFVFPTIPVYLAGVNVVPEIESSIGDVVGTIVFNVIPSSYWNS